jgi:hypothetical protein
MLSCFGVTDKTGFGFDDSIYCQWQWPRGLRHGLRSLERWNRGFESHSRHGWLYVLLFCACIVLCIGSGLTTGWSPLLGVLPTVYKNDYETEEEARAQYRAVDLLGRIRTCAHLGTTDKYSAIAILHTLQFTVTHALGFSVFTSRILATDSS